MFLGGPALSSASLETGGFGAPRGADLGMQKQREASLGVSRVPQLPHHWWAYTNCPPQGFKKKTARKECDSHSGGLEWPARRGFRNTQRHQAGRGAYRPQLGVPKASPGGPLSPPEWLSHSFHAVFFLKPCGGQFVHAHQWWGSWGTRETPRLASRCFCMPRSAPRGAPNPPVSWDAEDRAGPPKNNALSSSQDNAARAFSTLRGTEL